MNEISCVTKPEIWRLYRSYRREPPISLEHAQSYYYEYIELPGKVWVTREYEWEVTAALLGLDTMPGTEQRCRELQFMISEVQNGIVKCIDKYIVTAPKVDYNKRVLLDLVQLKNNCTKLKVPFILGVVGYTPTLQQCVSAIKPDYIVADNWCFPSDTKASIKEICSGVFPVLADSREIELNKENVSNWSTVRVVTSG